MKCITVKLSIPQAERLLDSLAAHMAGDTSEGDLCWTPTEHKTAERARQAIIEAMDGNSRETESD